MQITGQKKGKKPKKTDGDASTSPGGLPTPALATSVRVECLRPGMVVLRGALPPAVQQAIIDEAFALGGDAEDRARLLDAAAVAGATGVAPALVDALAAPRPPQPAAPPALTVVAPTDADVGYVKPHDAGGMDGGCGGDGFGPQQFYRFVPGPGGTQRLQLNQGVRGRLVATVPSLPLERADGGGFWTALCHRCVAAAHAADPAVPTDMVPTVALMNFYTHSGGFKEHVDSEHPEDVRRQSGPPIVSITLGDGCEFTYRDSYAPTDAAKVVALHNGDVLLFGGPARMVVHGVRKILPAGRTPGVTRGLPLPGRLNVTLRDVRKGVVDTAAFPAYRVSYT